MDLNEIYRSISGFWDSIAPVFIAHLIALVFIQWIRQGNFKVLPYLEYLITTDTYKRWVKIFDEFEQKSKIPYVVIILLLIYFVIFNNALNIMTLLPIVKISYSEQEFWEENRPILDLAEIGSYGKSADLKIWEISYMKNNFLEDYKNQFPGDYSSSISWHSREYFKWFTYYRISILFFVSSIVVFVVRKFRRDRNKAFYRRIFLLIILSLLSIGYSRYKAEQYIESRLKAEMRLVTRQLSVDVYAQNNKLPDNEIQKLKENLFEELKVLRQERFDIFWFSRLLEKYSIGKRTFPYMSDEEFYKEFEYLELNSTK